MMTGATWLLAFVLVFGLLSAFVGLNLNGFWVDELFTAWVVGSDHSLPAMLSRALTDNHPPLYNLAVFLFSEVFGASETALRAFSAICAIAAVLVFVVRADSFSLRARLFAATLATASTYWLAHSQEARSYALCLLWGSILSVAVFRVVEGRAGRADLIAAAAASLLGCLTHAYMLFVAESAVALILVYRPGMRWLACGWGALLFAVSLAYAELVSLHAQNSMVGWIGSSPAWYALEIWFAGLQTVAKLALPALVFAAICMVLFRRGVAPNRATVVAVVAPLLLLFQAIAVSILLAPSFTDRNLLLCSPFIWAALAGLYDMGVERSGRRRPALALIAAVLAALCAGAVAYRLTPHRAPFRESAKWIADQADCRGKPIPVLLERDPKMTSRNAELWARISYGYYLPGHPLRPTIKEDVLAGRPIPPSGCSVVAWGAHYLDNAVDARRIAQRLGARQKTFPIAGDANASAYVFLRSPQ
jgi:hypothetical protein